MSQNDFNIANQGFPATRADINSALQALASNSAGTAEPSTTYAYQFWYDETNELLKMRNSDNDAWITIGTFDQVADTFTPAGVTTDKIEEGNSSVEVVDTGTGYVAVVVDGVEAARVDANGRLGIGTTSPSTLFHIDAASDGRVARFGSGTSDTGGLYVTHNSGSTRSFELSADNILILDADRSNGRSSSRLQFNVDGTERMRIDSSGNLLVGKTSQGIGNVGFEAVSNGTVQVTRDGSFPLALNRLTSDGDIVQFRKDGSTIGAIGVDNSIGVRIPYLGSNNFSTAWANAALLPANGSGAVTDNAYDIGASSFRWDDIYATNALIQTSDRNEKQDIEALSDAEQRVAVVAKGLLRKYRWKDAVAEKGDAARIHFGIIAQDLQAAFEAEGLDAGRYGMFISNTWWEAERVIPAVEAQDAVYETVVIPAEYDADGNEISPETTEQRLVSEAVEAQPERTVTDTYQTQEEAPEGAVERTRMGVRYPELLAFIIAAI